MLMPSIFGENLFDEMMDFPWGNDFFGRRSPLYGKNEKNLMKTDVKETDGSYEVAIDLPGFKKEDVSATLENGYLTIQAVKGLDKEEKDKEGKYIRRERYAGSCSRSFYVGDRVKEEDIQARFEDGILKLSVPKKNEAIEEKKGYIAIEG
ncbi:Hsp20/alpha crystallin family protein [Qiania dongpingensis]|uniref:Hsp20/alpha crystallin family protein n=1 Tax=Qiania dongpingensis TaxID=2763669 RepID=A0A7G9G1J0_9FIRM|nr:Hsp20/alpha crystallin family protein [Qiania dongpingensis]QNM04672.1 Hsp20/alpha crystallin family protein [Qiania dongpingensis]